MRTFDYSHLPNELLNERIMGMVAFLHEHKGRQQLFIEQEADKLEALCEIAKIQSTDSSNRIEGISTTDKRLRELMEEKVTPRNRNEEEIVGYKDVLELIHTTHDAMDITPGVILQLHRDLFRHTKVSYGGKWKDSDNAIVEIDAQGNQRIRFRPTPARAVPDAMEQLCLAYSEAARSESIDRLLLTALFTFDFVCIHPFNDGNGRMSRLLTLLLLYKSGYLVGKYVSIEHEIERSKQTYYEALQMSSYGWSEGENDTYPFVTYLLGCLIGACRTFEERVDGIVINKSSKHERIEALMRRKLGGTTRNDIATACPDISSITITRTLASLLKQGKIEKRGAGRATKYVWIAEG